MRRASFVVAGLVMTSTLAMAESPPITHASYYTSSATEAYTANQAAATTAAVRFDVGNGSSIYYIELWFGPSGTERDVTLTIWDDTAETLDPGTMLSQEILTIEPSAMLQTRSVFVSSLTAKIRVGLTAADAGPPSVGLDLDGISAPDRNFIKVGTGTWQTAADAGLTGDWVVGIAHNGFEPGPNPTVPDADESGGDDGDDVGDDTTDDSDDVIEEGSDDDCSSSRPAGGGAVIGVLFLAMLLVPRRR